MTRYKYKIKAFVRLLLNLIKFKSLKKTINYFKYDWSLLTNHKINYTPPVLAATVTRQCNLRCPTCLYLLEDKNYLFNSFIDIFSFNNYMKKIDAAKADIIYFTGGEPLLNIDLGLMIDLCKYEYKLKTKISTNGILIEKNIDVLKKFDEVNISLDAYDIDSFKKYRGGTKEQWEKITDGLWFLANEGVNFSTSFLLSIENILEINKILKFINTLYQDKVYFHNINPHGSKDIKPLFIDDAFYFDSVLLRKDYDYDISLPYLFREGDKEVKCIQPWYYHCFDPEFNLAPCCHLEHSKKTNMESIRYIMKDKLFPSCLYCQRRFIGKEYATFNSKNKKWKVYN